MNVSKENEIKDRLGVSSGVVAPSTGTPPTGTPPTDAPLRSSDDLDDSDKPKPTTPLPFKVRQDLSELARRKL